MSEIAILIPVLGRPQQIEPVVRSITDSTPTPHQIVMICSPGDDQAYEEALKHADLAILTTWKAGKADYAKKLALGFKHTDEPWLFQAATDLVFHAGWDTAALLTARRSRRLVIGTNDLGNPLVKRGQHSTHTLFARDYILRYGGTVDGTGLIFSEAYDHQWTDSEFIETAKRRKQFAHAKASIVEHLHPHWGKGEMDDTYRKAHRETTQDQRLFAQRRSLVARNAKR